MAEQTNNSPFRDPAHPGSTRPFWLARESSARIAAFRIVFGLVMFADVAHVFAHRQLFASDYSGGVALAPLLIVWMIILAALTLGLFTRLAAAANFLVAAYLIGSPSAALSQLAGDSIAISLGLFAIFLHCGQSLSLDSWLGRSFRTARVFAAERWLLAAYLGLVYLDSGIHKLHSPMWRAGLGVIGPASLPNLVWINTAWLESIPAPLLRFLGWGIILFEISFLTLYYWKRTRTAIVLLGIALHLGIAILYPIPAFSGLMLAAYAALLPASWYLPLERFDHWIRSRHPISGRPLAPGSRRFHLPLRTSVRAALMAASLWAAVSGINLFVDTWPSYTFDRLWSAVLGRSQGDKPATQNALNTFSLWWTPVRWRLFRFTGLAAHGVFDDSLFVNYKYQIRLVPVNPGSQPRQMPYLRSGLFAWSFHDRVWELWWKRTQSPWTTIEDAQRRLSCFAAFYWPPEQGAQEVRIEARPQQVSLDHYDSTVFRKNLAVPWRRIGTIRLIPGLPAAIQWSTPPGAPGGLLGAYIPRALAAGRSNQLTR